VSGSFNRAIAVLRDLKTIYPSELAQSIVDLETSSLVPFPQFDGSKFRRLMDKEMGFES
jgi:beta-1,4-N-acetylglucosaminyltransferase